MTQSHVGGSFAPPLTDDLLDRYQGLIDALPAGRVKDALNVLLNCCRRWWDLPEPNGTPTRAHPAGVGTVVSLDPAHAAELSDHIPWSARSNGSGGTRPDELESIQALCDTIDPEADKELRDAAHHLLWHVVELDLDREPMTKDKLSPQ